MKPSRFFSDNFIYSSKLGGIFLFLFLLAYILLIVYLGDKAIIWQDEACSLYTAINPLPKVLHLSYSFEGQPPVYFLLLSVWLKICNSIWFARLLSLIFTLLSAIIIHKIGKLILSNLYSKWVIVLFLLNPYTIELCIEARLYSFLIFLCLTTIYLFYQIYYFDKPKLKPIYLLIGIVGIYTQYYFAFLLLSLAILLFITKGWRPFFNFCLLSLIIVVAIFPNYFFIKDQFLMHKPTEIVRPWFEWIAYIFYSPAHLIINVNDLISGMTGRVIGQVVFTLLFILIGYKLFNTYKYAKNKDIKKIIELCTLVIILLSVFLSLFIITNLTYSLRYLSVIFPIYFLILVAVSVYKDNIKNIIYGSFATYYILLLIINYQPPLLKTSDGKSTAQYISNIEDENEPIIFREKILSLLVNPYYNGHNQFFSIRSLEDIANYKDIEVKDTLDFKNTINRFTLSNKTFLYINGNDIGFVNNNELSNSEVDKYFSKHYLVKSDTIINGRLDRHFIRIRRFVKIDK